MDCVGAHSPNTPLYIAWSGKREPDFRITRHRQGPKLVRAKELQFRSKRARLSRNMVQGAHDAVDLWMPGVGGHQNLHAVKPLRPSVARAPWSTRPRDRY